MVTEVDPLVIIATADAGSLQELQSLLVGASCRVAAVTDAGQLAASLAGERPAVLLLDPALQNDGGERLLAEHPGLPVAMLVGRDATGPDAVAMHRAAYDYLT